jgi:hypothetical protein
MQTWKDRRVRIANLDGVTNTSVGTAVSLHHTISKDHG